MINNEISKKHAKGFAASLITTLIVAILFCSLLNPTLDKILNPLNIFTNPFNSTEMMIFFSGAIVIVLKYTLACYHQDIYSVAFMMFVSNMIFLETFFTPISNIFYYNDPSSFLINVIFSITSAIYYIIIKVKYNNSNPYTTIIGLFPYLKSQSKKIYYDSVQLSILSLGTSFIAFIIYNLFLRLLSELFNIVTFGFGSNTRLIIGFKFIPNLICNSITYFLSSIYLNTIDSIYTYNISYSDIKEEDLDKIKDISVDDSETYRYYINKIVISARRSRHFQHQIVKSMRIVQKIKVIWEKELENTLTTLDDMLKSRKNYESKWWQDIPHVIKYNNNDVPKTLCDKKEEKCVIEKKRSYNFIDIFSGFISYKFNLMILLREYHRKVYWINLINGLITDLKKTGDEYKILAIFDDNKLIKKVKRDVDSVEKKCNIVLDKVYE
ncbi:hypothetical protein TCON_1490 [Astathelohania contejeani]|uniref:Uncharacterized protein n=1 Tax=Astathelohania contejeani TaxID=164912 RepID=A0ABQ7HYT1_9MICR|nr:hypothetical protein TCON_1490 [Thelohania contejeani]